jgi:ATP-dependent RNA helicase DeaD
MAGVRATWSPPPAADEIRAMDQERLLREIAPAGELPAEDLAAARALVAERGAEAVAAALLRLHRAGLPAPEEVFDGAAAEPPPVRAPRERGSEGDVVWFRMNVGRMRNADPRWLIPLICRRGHVTKKEIGAIRIADRETRFEIARHAADRFAAAARRPDEEDGSVRIEPVRGDRPVQGGDQPRRRTATARR